MAWQATVLTLFPDMFPGSLGLSLAGKALEDGTMECWAADAEGAQCAQMSVQLR